MFYGITLIVLGILASPSILLSRKPDAQSTLDSIRPYQGWIGLIFCFLGLVGVAKALMNMNVLAHWPIWWLTWMGSSLIQATLGFILGYGLIQDLILSRNDDASEKGAEILEKLTPIQGKLGLAGVVIGIWVIVARLLFFG